MAGLCARHRSFKTIFSKTRHHRPFSLSSAVEGMQQSAKANLRVDLTSKTNDEH